MKIAESGLREGYFFFTDLSKYEVNLERKR